MIRKTNIQILVLIVILVSCTKSTTKEGLQEFIFNPENGFIQTSNSDQIQYTLVYKPYELIFKVNSNEKDSDFVGRHYFQLNMTANIGGEISGLVRGREEYEELVNTLNYGVLEKFYLINDKSDTTFPLGVTSSNTYNHGSSTSLLFLFESKNLFDTKEIRLILERLSPIDLQGARFKYKSKDIRKYPQLKI